MTKQASATVFAAGEAPQLWIDGVKNALAVTPGTPAGTLNITDVLELGRGNRPTTPPIGYFKGRCSFFALSSRRQPDEVLDTITRAFKDPQQVYGHGTVNLQTDAVRSPVALLTTTTSGPGTAVTVDVGAASYDPASLPLTCTAAAITSGNGGVTRSGDNVTITPASDAVAGDVVVCEYTLANSSGKTSSNRVHLTVSGVVRPPVQATPDAFTATAGTTATYSPLSNDTPSTGVTIASIQTLTGGSTAAILLPGRTQISYTPRSSTTAFTETVDYVASDTFTSATGRITFTVSPAAQPVAAAPDSFNATAGVQQDYSPLDNDTGTGLTITSLGTLTGGSTRSIVNSATQVRYTPRASTTDFTEGLTYAIADNKTPPGTATGAITFTVAGVTAEAWPYSGSSTDGGDAMPASTNTLTVTGSTDAARETSLRAHLTSAQCVPGTDIVCPAGTYSGTFTMGKSGNGNTSTTGVPTAMIRIRAADPSIDTTVNNGVYFSGTVILGGNFTAVVGRGIRINLAKIDGKGCRISRCVFRGSSGDIIEMTGGAYGFARIDRNWFDGVAGQITQGGIDPSTAAVHPCYGCRFYRNYIVDHRSTGSTVHVHQKLTALWVDSHDTYDYNFYNKVLVNKTTGSRFLIECKAGGSFLRRNTFDCTSGACNINMRETRGTQVIENWMMNDMQIQVRGADHLIKGNHHETQTAVGIDIRAGEGVYCLKADKTPDLGDSACQSGMPWGSVTNPGPNKYGRTVAFISGGACDAAQTAARFITCVTNTCRISIGNAFTGHTTQCRDITLTDNRFTASISAGGTVETSVTQTGDPNTGLAVQAVKLKVPSKTGTDDVGPWRTS